jgi:hypothetical protein
VTSAAPPGDALVTNQTQEGTAAMINLRDKSTYDLTNEIEQLTGKIGDQLTSLANEKLSLEALGITNAGTHYRDGIYLYLVHPTAPDGSRKREYIGKDPEKIKAALARLERFKRHAVVTQEINTLKDKLESTNRELENIIQHLKYRVW